MTMGHDQTTNAPGRFAAPWAAFLVAASATGSLVFACATPLAALAAVAAMTLPLRMALATVAGVWLANQAIGYGLLAYPVDANSLAWGVALGVAAIAAAAAAGAALARIGDRPELARWVVGFAAALVVHQSVLFGTSLILGSGEGFTAAAVGGIATLNATWAAGLAVLYRVLTAVFGTGIGLDEGRVGSTRARLGLTTCSCYVLARSGGAGRRMAARRCGRWPDS